MAKELTYKDEAAAGYDRAFGHVTTHFAPYLLRAAHIVPGMRVLDIATGTGLAAEAALRIVGARTLLRRRRTGPGETPVEIKTKRAARCLLLRPIRDHLTPRPGAATVR